MTARNQWSQGLQWGACAWLGYVAWHAVLDCYDTSPGWVLDVLPGRWYLALYWFLAPAWLLAIALIAAGSSRSRAVVGVAILTRVVMGCAESGRPFGEFIPHWAMQNFLPMCLPLFPLVVLRVEEPRVGRAHALPRFLHELALEPGARQQGVDGDDAPPDPVLARSVDHAGESPEGDYNVTLTLPVSEQCGLSGGFTARSKW
jgi:hypothetical protein